MRKSVKYLAAIASVLLLCWLGYVWQQRVALERLSRLRVGMTLAEVTALLGEPIKSSAPDLCELEAVSVEGKTTARTTRMSWAYAGEDWYSVSFTPEEGELLFEADSVQLSRYTWKAAGHVVMVFVNSQNQVVTIIVKPLETHPEGKHKPWLTQMEERIRLMMK